MPRPVQIELQKKSRRLSVDFDDGARADISFVALRLHTPSAEGKPQKVDDDITVLTIEPVGNYAIRPHFSDGHQSGIYTWDLLYSLGKSLEKERDD